MKPTYFFFSLFLIILSSNLYAQEKSITVSQDYKFEQLMVEKRKINATIMANDRYKVQIFSGDTDSAKKNLSDYRKASGTNEGTIIFNTPNYKVWIGNYKTRIEAERNLKELLKKYPNALLIKPSKS